MGLSPLVPSMTGESEQSSTAAPEDESDENLSFVTSLDEEPDAVQAGLAVTVITAVATILASFATTTPPGLIGDGGASVSAGLGTTLLWMFFAAHGVPILISPPEWSFAGPLIGSSLVYVVPPTALFVGGAGLSRAFGAASPRQAARSGASIVVGYVLLFAGGLLLGSFVVEASFASITVRPDPLRTILAGVFYPLAFGTAGGLTAYALGIGVE